MTCRINFEAVIDDLPRTDFRRASSRSHCVRHDSAILLQPTEERPNGLQTHSMLYRKRSGIEGIYRPQTSKSARREGSEKIQALVGGPAEQERFGCS